MTIPIRNVYYLLCYAWRHVDQSDLVDVGTLDRLRRVEDLLAKVLAEGTFRLVRRGVDRGYREITEEIAGVRGKLQLGAMATRAVRARSRTLCTFEELSPDLLHNRILRSTLDALERSGSLDPGIRRDVGLARRRLGEITPVRVSRQLFNLVQLNRNQRHYRFLLDVCRLVHESFLVEEGGDGGPRFHDFRRDENQVWRLFEDFVREFYRTEQTDLRALPERRVRWDGLVGRTSADEECMPAMYSDLLLESRDRRIVLDVKFYGEPLKGLKKIHSGHLYQLLAYLENRRGNLPEGPPHEGILLYAAVGQTFRIEFRVRGFRIQARTVDLASPWAEIHEEMLEVLEVNRPAVAAPASIR